MDVYFQPLIDELTDLWTLRTASSGEMFQLHAAWPLVIFLVMHICRDRVPKRRLAHALLALTILILNVWSEKVDKGHCGFLERTHLFREYSGWRVSRRKSTTSLEQVKVHWARSKITLVNVEEEEENRFRSDNPILLLLPMCTELICELPN